MNKTHLEVVEEAEARLLDAMVNADFCALHQLLHENLVYTNENGEAFTGFNQLPITNPQHYRITSIETLERNICFFNNVAVATVIERRTGLYHQMKTNGTYSITRVWKFNRHWQVISATAVRI